VRWNGIEGFFIFSGWRGLLGWSLSGLKNFLFGICTTQRKEPGDYLKGFGYSSPQKEA